MELWWALTGGDEQIEFFIVLVFTRTQRLRTRRWKVLPVRMRSFMMTRSVTLVSIVSMTLERPRTKRIRTALSLGTTDHPPPLHFIIVVRPPGIAAGHLPGKCRVVVQRYDVLIKWFLTSAMACEHASGVSLKFPEGVPEYP